MHRIRSWCDILYVCPMCKNLLPAIELLQSVLEDKYFPKEKVKCAHFTELECK